MSGHPCGEAGTIAPARRSTGVAGPKPLLGVDIWVAAIVRGRDEDQDDVSWYVMVGLTTMRLIDA